MAGSNLTPTVDPTGSLSKTDMLNTDVNNLINAYNAGRIDFNNFNTPLIIPDANGIPNVMLGPRQVNNQRGLFIAKPGVNVVTATDDQLIFNSSQNIFKIVTTGTGVTPSSSVGASPGWGVFSLSPITQAHSLSFVPIVMGFVQVGSKYVLMPYTFFSSTGANIGTFETPVVSADATNVYINTDCIINVTSGSPSVNIGGRNVKYYLLQESAA